ncbi:MAG: hypothetical protein H0V91_04575 [Flavisolibacter sp.]|nr:hypothetical protein [Flavisolibacter sp.]
MQRNYNNEDFEQFLKQSADSYRMRPSDKVWKGISNSLSERRRKIGFTTGGFLVIASILGYFLIDTSKNIALPEASAQVELNSNSATNAASANKNNTEAPVISIANKKSTEFAISQNQLAKVVPLYDQPALILSKEENELSASQIPVDESSTEVESAAFNATIIDSEIEAETEGNNEPATLPAVDKEELPLSIESVTNLYAKGKRNNLSLQFTFTPTVSYRKLSENKDNLRSLPQNTTAYNINNAVTHKPDIGLEVGLALKYELTNKVNLKGGLQFNMSRYDIKAFSTPAEVAMIALSNRNTNTVAIHNSVTNIRNFNGTDPDWFQNLYYQLSAPVGLDVFLINAGNARFGIGGTFQPTYIMSDRAYLLSSDYKNYALVPWLTRRWNMNTSFETFVNYSTGKLQWQVGPQVRYQMLSSFASKYPVKENLFDFGLKVGVSLSNSQ